MPYTNYNSFTMISVPKLSAVMTKKHAGKVAIVWDDQIVGIGSNSILALKKAQEQIPHIAEKDFLVFRIHNDNDVLIAWVSVYQWTADDNGKITIPNEGQILSIFNW